MARLFVAVWPPDEVVAELMALGRKDRRGVRFVHPERWHVTLRFLGECDPGAARAARSPAIQAWPVAPLMPAAFQRSPSAAEAIGVGTAVPGRRAQRIPTNQPTTTTSATTPSTPTTTTAMDGTHDAVDVTGRDWCPRGCARLGRRRCRCAAASR